MAKQRMEKYLERLKDFTTDYSEGLSSAGVRVRAEKLKARIDEIVTYMERSNPIIVNSNSEAFMIRVLDAAVICGILDKFEDLSKCRDKEFITNVINKVDSLGVDYQNTVEYCIKVYEDLERLSYVKVWKKADIYRYSRKLQKVIFLIENNKVTFNSTMKNNMIKWNYKFNAFISRDSLNNI